MIKLLTNASVTGQALSLGLSGVFCFAVAGTFGGASVGLQMLGPDGATWINVRDGAGVLALIEADAVLVNLPAGSYRAAVTGGSGTSLHAALTRAGA